MYFFCVWVDKRKNNHIHRYTMKDFLNWNNFATQITPILNRRLSKFQHSKFNKARIVCSKDKLTTDPMKNTTTNKLLFAAPMLLLLLTFLFTIQNVSAQNSVKTGVTFNWQSTGGGTNPAVLESLEYQGRTYDKFAVPSSYELVRLGPDAHSLNNLRRNGTVVLNNSSNPAWNATAADIFQDQNLNAYFESNDNGENICGSFSAADGSNTQLQALNFDGFPINEFGLLAVTERNANNCFYIEVYGKPVNASAPSDPVIRLGRTFVREYASAQVGSQNNLPPISGADYWRTQGRADNNGTIGIAIYELDEFAPQGSIITQVVLGAASDDHGDGKIFIVQEEYAQDDSYDVRANQTFVGNVGDNDGVPAGATFTLESTPAQGSISLNPSTGEFTYTPPANGNPGGTPPEFTFTYRVQLPAPNNGISATATVTLRILDDLPIANDFNQTVNEDSNNNRINLTGNSYGDDGPAASNSLVINGGGPANGTVTYSNNGTPNNAGDDFFLYTPNANFNGNDSFTYTITDSNGDTDTGTITITINPDAPNADGPTAVDDTFTVNEDSTNNNLDILDNDSFGGDGPPNSVAITIITPPSNGNASVNNNGTPSNPNDDFIEYTPDANFNGTDTFEYRLVDSNGTTDNATVTITIDPDAPNADGPNAVDDSYTVNEDSTNNNFDVLDNDDFGGDGPPNNVAISITTPPTNGSVNINNNGTPANPNDDFIEYTPDANFNGTDSFVYQIVDSNGTTDNATVSITINPDAPNADGPTAVDDVEIMLVDAPATPIDILNNDSFGGDGPPIGNAITITTNPSNGTVVVNDNGTPNDPTDDFVTYQPDPFFVGTDTFEYEIVDANGTTDTAEVTITVNDNPNRGIRIINANLTEIEDDNGTATGNSVTIQLELEGSASDYPNGGPSISWTTRESTNAGLGADERATNNVDFTENSGTGTMAFGTPFEITIDFIADTLIEEGEFFELVVNSADVSLPSPLVAEIEITDNDINPGDGISIRDIDRNEGDGTITFEVVLTGNVPAFQVDWELEFGTATIEDFTNDPIGNPIVTSGTLNFDGTDGEIETITFPIFDDDLFERFRENFFINLVSENSGFVDFNDPRGRGRIQDNDNATGPGEGLSLLGKSLRKELMVLTQLQVLPLLTMGHQ